MSKEFYQLYPQQKTVLRLLQKGHISNVQAIGYGIFSVSKVISDLKRDGYSIESTFKKDGFGRKYVSYSLGNPEHAI